MRYLKAVFISVIGLMFLLIVATPLLVHRGVALSDRVIFEEETIEAFLIVVLFAVAYLASRAYRRLVANNRRKLLQISADRNVLAERLADAFHYIGTINVQLQEIDTIFSDLKRLPENRNEFKTLLATFGSKLLGIVNVDWALIRILDRERLRTIVEHREDRLGRLISDPHIGNRTVVKGGKTTGCIIVTGAKENLPILTACVLPLKHLEKQESILLQALVDEIEMLFIISNLYPAVKSVFPEKGKTLEPPAVAG